jgi:lipopolysaccharide export system protein LptA
MITRLLRSTISLAAIVVVYQLYALLVVPCLEPALTVQQQQASTAAEQQMGRRLADKYQQLLANYFPPAHWSQTRPPKVIKSGHGMLVIDDYHQEKPGQIELSHFALLFFPSPVEEGQPAPTDVIIVEAPSGAAITFDENFNPASGRLGRIVSGELNGLVTIRSDMRQPGPADDLFIQTGKLRLNSKGLLETSEQVEFRLGSHRGRGRQLEIQLLDEEQTGEASTGVQFSGIEAIRVRQNVYFQLGTASGKLVPGDTTDQPVEITCTGPFEFQLVGDQQDYVARFQDNVEVWQFNPKGPSDQMTCKQLNVQFAPKQIPGFARPIQTGERQRAEFSRLEPYALEATGSPVIMLSPQRNFEARSARMRLTIPEQKISLDGDVQLRSDQSVVRAPAIVYTHPASEAGTQIGAFRAQGAGNLSFVPNPEQPNDLLTVAWQDSVQLVRQEGEPVLWLQGRPRLAMQGRGQLVADEIKVYLREIAPDEPTASMASSLSGHDQEKIADEPQKQDTTTVRPDRLLALGNVMFDSPQLAGQTHELSTWFRYEIPQQADLQQSGSSRFDLANPAQAEEGYAIQADRLRLEIVVQGRRAEPANLFCDGNVVFRETRTRDPSAAPLVLYGQRLTLEDMSHGATRVAVLGSDANGGQPARLAEMTARGVTLMSRAVYLDEARNHAWIEGAGEAHLKLAEDLQGRPTETPYPLAIRWEKGLNFDGRKVQLSGDVFAEGPEDWLRCDQLVGTLSRPVDFGTKADQTSLELSELDCQGHVVFDHRTRDAGGPTSHERLQLAQLAINQKSGQIRGRGPGWVRSVHYGEELQPTMKPRPDAAAISGGPRLHFLRVNFQNGVTGNLHQRQLAFLGRVRTVYGPVDAWEQELDLRHPEQLPPSAVTLRCAELAVNEDLTVQQKSVTSANPETKFPLGGLGQGQFGPVELLASGDVTIEGTTDQQQRFKAIAGRASFNQFKDVFVLEGDGNSSATIYLWRGTGTAPQQSSARKITYWRTSGEIHAQDIRSIDLTPAPSAAFAPQPSFGPAAIQQR